MYLFYTPNSILYKHVTSSTHANKFYTTIHAYGVYVKTCIPNVLLCIRGIGEHVHW